MRRVPLRHWSYAVRGMHGRLKRENSLEEKDVDLKKGLKISIQTNATLLSFSANMSQSTIQTVREDADIIAALGHAFPGYRDRIEANGPKKLRVLTVKISDAWNTFPAARLLLKNL